MESDDVYLGGALPFQQRFEKSRRPFVNPGKYLPAVDCDLDMIISIVVPAPEVDYETIKRASIERRYAEFQAEFEGRSELLLLHSMLVAMLRRNDPPREALKLFVRLWEEKGDYLANELSMRWKVSAATTFGDCGETLEQRAVGMGLSILFDSIKLHESERRLSGQRSELPFPTVSRKERHAIAFDVKPFSVARGDMDRNLLARLSLMARKDEAIYPLAYSMLSEIMTDQRTVFARLQKLRIAEWIEKA
ncbi:hypothetical protein [Octadecabacter ascidiaceicola]|uniref:Uncharacterized protein n=1 Tax=Octadecabacter ascidiaceicola TaxID=1655543 RepID=A0A238KIN4_9RHOB|nr:hypothetical protein [Octadecabacter ascidiaceicola]SMX42653.1 hypothetical protein OCA8868_02807 [Octadecabacter ascidiaceicola]